jgi:AcrR family transcriptional regulator
MRTPRVDVARIRREQVIEAAVAVIAEQGLQNLSLSEIEQKAGMSRGQLTYYFPAKEGILLAVFDRLLQLMKERVRAGGDSRCACPGEPWERLRHFLTKFLLEPPLVPEFHSLQYTFLSQIGHREDFRLRLANLYEEWRAHMARDFAGALAEKPAAPAVSPRTLATFVQALLHGLAVQRAADPDAFDRQEVLDFCLNVLGAFLRPGGAGPEAPASAGAATDPHPNGSPRRDQARRRTNPKRVNHDRSQ